MRGRIDALRGVSLGKKLINQSRSALRTAYQEWHDTKAVFYSDAARDINEASAPVTALIENDPRSTKSLYRRRQIEKKLSRVKKPAVPSWSGDAVVPGSLIVFKAPPYDFDFVDNNNGGSSSAIARTGDMTAFCNTFGSGSQTRSGATGMGVYFQPLHRRSLVRFSPFVTYSYAWYIRSSGRQAISRGMLGLQLHSWDLSGRNFRRELDVQIPLWQDRTTGFDTDGDAADSLIIPPAQSRYFFLSEARLYAHWVYAWVMVYADEGGILSSHARAEVVVSAPFMVFET